MRGDSLQKFKKLLEEGDTDALVSMYNCQLEKVKKLERELRDANKGRNRLFESIDIVEELTR